MAIFQLRMNNPSSKHTPWCSNAHTTVNNFRANAILATCAGFLCRNPA